MEYLAKLLGTNKEYLSNLTDEMSEFTGKKGIPEKFLADLGAEKKEALN